MINDEMLKQAAAELATAMNESLPDPEECVHQFSPQFEKKIKKLTRRTNHPIMYRSLQSVACVLLVIIIGFCSVLAASAKSATYYPGWLPEDCEFVTSYETSGGEVIIYSAAQESLVQFSYISDPNSEKMYMDGVEADKKTVWINECPGEIYISQNEGETNNIVWTNESQTVLFSISGDYNEEILIKMAENIVKK